MSYPFYSFPADHKTGSYVSGQVSVGTTATLICAPTANQSGVLINNTGATVYLGGPNVTTGTGFPVPTGTTDYTVPTNGGVINQLYGITSSGTTVVSYLYPPAGGTPAL